MIPYDHLRVHIAEQQAAFRAERASDALAGQARGARPLRQRVCDTAGLTLIHLGERLRGEIWARLESEPETGRGVRLNGVR